MIKVPMQGKGRTCGNIGAAHIPTCQKGITMGRVLASAIRRPTPTSKGKGSANKMTAHMHNTPSHLLTPFVSEWFTTTIDLPFTHRQER